MELVKNIFFNTDKLVENTKVKISYTGELFQSNSEKVFLHFGFGENWDNTTDLEMERTELGFQAEIELIESTLLNFCFKNENNEWDNNHNENYIFPIEKVELALVSIGDGDSLLPTKRLRKSYILSKKLKLAIYKIIHYLPKLISGNYKRKLANNADEQE